MTWERISQKHIPPDDPSNNEELQAMERMPRRRARDAGEKCILRLPDVIKRTGVGRSFIYSAMDAGNFPRPVEHHNGASIGTSDEREDEHDGREPSLGSLNWATERVVVGRDKQGRAVKEIFREGDQSRWASGSLNDVELDAAHEEGGIEDEPHDADTDQDGCPSQDGVPFMFGGDRRGDVAVSRSEGEAVDVLCVSSICKAVTD